MNLFFIIILLFGVIPDETTKPNLHPVAKDNASSALCITFCGAGALEMYMPEIKSISFDALPKRKGRTDLSGSRFTRWQVVGPYGMIGPKLHWVVKCDCGNFSVVMTSNLNQGLSRSCGCLQKETASKTMLVHGQGTFGKTKTRENRIWVSMIARCTNPNSAGWKNYGGRGISVCDRWRHSFLAFFEDMGKCADGYSLERRENNGNYCKENCYWATRKQQNNNKRSNVILQHEGISLTISQWSEKAGINYGTLRSRLRDGCSVAEALTNPVAHKSSKRKDV